MLQPLIWQHGVRAWNQDENGPSELSMILEALVRWTGGVAIAGAVIAVLATSFGQRYAVVRQHGRRATAVFAFASAVIVSLGGVSMTLESGNTSGHLDVIPVSVFVLAPLMLVALQSLRLVRA